MGTDAVDDPIHVLNIDSGDRILDAGSSMGACKVPGRKNWLPRNSTRTSG